MSEIEKPKLNYKTPDVAEVTYGGLNLGTITTNIPGTRYEVRQLLEDGLVMIGVGASIISASKLLVEAWVPIWDRMREEQAAADQVEADRTPDERVDQLFALFLVKLDEIRVFHDLSPEEFLEVFVSKIDVEAAYSAWLETKKAQA